MAQDYRRVDEHTLLTAVRDGHPLALAEAYHRTVPAAHAVARRLLTSAADIEELLLATYRTMWDSPPEDGALEGWVRRTVWSGGTDRLRARGSGPASPSVASLLPDLPPPDVRFLDAAERAISELPEAERRALLLAHDKGIGTPEQDQGADSALVQALTILAGAETSTADRSALEEDGCDDLSLLGDWCLGLVAGPAAAVIEQATEERPGCAALLRALRRGRRRIEGLPATPDMGHRILVTVLSGAAPLSAAAATAAAAPAADDVVLIGGGEEAPTAPPAEAVAADIGAADDGERPYAEEDVSTDGGLAAVLDTDDDPFADLREEQDHDESGPAAPAAPAVLDTDELSVVEPAADEADGPESAPLVPEDADDGDWAPTPGDTAELRLSDILAGDEEDEDPFALLEAEDAEEHEPASADPYAALRDIPEADTSETADGTGAAKVPAMAAAGQTLPGAGDLDGAEEVYVEGQEDLASARAPRRGFGAFLLYWLLPILAGGGLGLVVAFLVFDGAA